MKFVGQIKGPGYFWYYEWFPVKGGAYMKTLFTWIMTLVLLFGFAVGAYICFFKIPLKDPKAKVVAFLVVGAAAAAFTFVLCLTVLWPPAM